MVPLRCKGVTGASATFGPVAATVRFVVAAVCRWGLSRKSIQSCGAASDRGTPGCPFLVPGGALAGCLLLGLLPLVVVGRRPLVPVAYGSHRH